VRRDVGRRSTGDAWEEVAAVAPEFAVLTDGRRGEAFYDSGRETVHQILGDIARRGFSTRGLALDFGCGMGRLTLPLATRFERAIGVDHSPTMLRLARERARLVGCANVTFALSSGDRFPDVASASADFALSLLVFQHMPSDDAVHANIRELQRCLVPGGLAWLQFDTRPSSLAYWLWDRLERRLPSGLGPRTRRAPLRRYRRASPLIREWLVSSGFDVLRQSNPDTELHGYLLRRS